jgi:hypothetical protein
MDDILTEEVYYLNYIEAQYRVERSEWDARKKGTTESQRMYENKRCI